MRSARDAWRRFCSIGASFLWWALCTAPAAWAQDAATLHARHEALRSQLASNPFERPLVLDSSQHAGDLRGDVYAVVAQPFGVVRSALQGMNQWCDLLMLHLNVKSCSYAGQPPGELLSLVIGRKFDQPLDDGYKVDFAWQTPVSTPEYLRVQMSAVNGPMGTHDYHLALEAIALDAHHSFIHMSYSYAYGMVAKLAMQAYLATAGREKVGFSITGQTSGGKPVYVDGMRGVAERNTMRYYLAVEVYLASLSAPAAQRQDKRLADWYDATERNALQLHEMGRDDYLAMKRHELQRQAGAPPGAAR